MRPVCFWQIIVQPWCFHTSREENTLSLLLRSRTIKRPFALICVLLAVTAANPQQPTPNCSRCAEWNTPQQPFRIFGNTFYVGPHGLASILITSPHGHILIDGDLQESAPLIAANIRALGFQLKDVKLILNTHVHYDHAAGLAELQRLTGARVLASPWSAAVLTSGVVAKDDPQFGDLPSIQPVANVRTLRDGEILRVGPLAITAHFTPGHTAGGTSFTWQSCQAGECRNMVYADSISSVSADSYKFADRPQVLASFQQSFRFLDAVPCDILLTPHPEASDFWQRVAARDRGDTPNPLVDPSACRRLAQHGREQLQKRVASEAGER
jgi:metallo-beta-lactamase class B